MAGGPSYDARMRIVDIRDGVVPIRSAIRNAAIDFSQMTVAIVAVITDAMRDGHPVVGYGFHSNGRYAPTGLLRDRFIPRLRGAPAETLVDGSGAIDPHRVWAHLMSGEKPGGHGERSVAVGVLDMAIWDAVAKCEGKPLCRLLAERYGGGKPEKRVFVYAAGGYYYPGKDTEALREELRRYLGLGYTVCKIKIGGATLDEDLRRIDAAASVVGSPSRLAVDANGRFDLETGLAYAKALAPYGLSWFEEACDPLDYALQAVLAERYPGAMATGENLFSRQDARNLLRHGGMRPDRDILQFDCSLSYGLVEYLRILDVVRAHGWSLRRVIPHGGHQLSLAIASGLGLGGNESYPEVFRPFNGFADAVPVEGGYVRLADLPGIGVEGKAELYSVLSQLAH